MEAYEELEQKFGEWINGGYMVACSSGTTALHLALEALDLPKGSRVLVPDFTMIACARAVIMAGLEPVFVDCSDDLLIDVKKIPEIISIFGWYTFSAIMPVHIYGRLCDMKSIYKLAQSHNFKVIEDCAESHGAFHNDGISDAHCYSFYKNKIVAGEEGGIIDFHEERHADRARSLRSLGFTDSHNFMHEERGISARLSNANAELILQSLKEADHNIRCCRVVERMYDSFVPHKYKMPNRDVPWVYDLRIPGITWNEQDRLVSYLRSKNIQARHGFKPMTMQPEFLMVSETHRNSYRLSREIIYLPIHPLITREQVKYNVETLVTAIRSSGL